MVPRENKNNAYAKFGRRNKEYSEVAYSGDDVANASPLARPYRLLGWRRVFGQVSFAGNRMASVVFGKPHFSGGQSHSVVSFYA